MKKLFKAIGFATTAMSCGFGIGFLVYSLGKYSIYGLIVIMFIGLILVYYATDR